MLKRMFLTQNKSQKLNQQNYKLKVISFYWPILAIEKGNLCEIAILTPIYNL